MIWYTKKLMNRKIIIACCVILGLYIGCSLMPEHSEFDDKATLEDVMEIQLPSYKVKKYMADPVIDCQTQRGRFFLCMIIFSRCG